MALSLACGRLESVVLSFCIIARRSERGMGSQVGRALACCKVGLERPLIQTAVVGNLSYSARLFRGGPIGRGWETAGPRARGGSRARFAFTGHCSRSIGASAST